MLLLYFYARKLIVFVTKLILGIEKIGERKTQFLFILSDALSESIQSTTN